MPEGSLVALPLATMTIIGLGFFLFVAALACYLYVALKSPVLKSAKALQASVLRVRHAVFPLRNPVYLHYTSLGEWRKADERTVLFSVIQVAEIERTILTVDAYRRARIDYENQIRALAAELGSFSSALFNPLERLAFVRYSRWVPEVSYEVTCTVVLHYTSPAGRSQKTRSHVVREADLRFFIQQKAQEDLVEPEIVDNTRSRMAKSAGESPYEDDGLEAHEGELPYEPEVRHKHISPEVLSEGTRAAIDATPRPSFAIAPVPVEITPRTAHEGLPNGQQKKTPVEAERFSTYHYEDKYVIKIDIDDYQIQKVLSYIRFSPKNEK